MPDPAASPAASMEASLARTAQQYDAVPYMAIPFSRLHPARMRAMSLLLGLKAAPAATARTLEIGCATGGHIIPAAAAFRQAQFVGLDVSAAQIALGRQRIDRLGLRNIELQARSLTELGPQDGFFDYIICHGVYSWIPQGVRETLMRVVAERLAPDGIAAISFNVLPGWRMFQVVRDSMILHAGASATHEERSARARRLFAAMEQEGAKDTSYGNIWRVEARRMSDLPDFYLAHELFEDNNSPCSFDEFMGEAGRHGLAYLGETRASGNIPENSGARRAELIRELSGGGLEAMEKYMDIVTGRTFRESLLIRAARAPLANRSLEDARLEGLHIIVPAAFRFMESATAACAVTDGDTEIDINDAGVAAALREMMARNPRSSSLDELAPRATASPEQRARLASVLMGFVRAGLLDITSEPVACVTEVSGKPRVWPLAASDAEAGLERTATLRHTLYDLKPFAHFLLPLIDGTRTRAELAEKIVAQTSAGGSQITDAAGPVTDPARIREICGAMLDRELANLAAAGLLVG